MWCFFLVLMLPWRWLAWRGKPRLWQKDQETRFANSVTGDVVRASALDCRVFHLISDQHRKDRLFVTPRLQSSVNWERGVTCLTRGHCGRRLWFVATRHLFSGSSLSAAIVAAFLLPCETFGCGDSSCVTSVTCHVARALSLPPCWHLQTSHSSRHETKRQTREETKASNRSAELCSRLGSQSKSPPSVFILQEPKLTKTCSRWRETNPQNTHQGKVLQNKDNNQPQQSPKTIQWESSVHRTAVASSQGRPKSEL